MNVFFSNRAGKHAVYHQKDCPYEKRIGEHNRIEITVKQAKKRHYCACKYCGGEKWEKRLLRERVAKWQSQYDLKITYWEDASVFFIETKIGRWKACKEQDSTKYVLYHQNERKPGYHRQHDMKKTASLETIIDYVSKHDKAKEIIRDDYRKLPQSTKQQKQYFQSAKRRAKRAERRRVRRIFAMLEEQQPELKEISIFGYEMSM
ncbi:hypothetical protein SAMN02910358_00678 [Lachnospiraceae bacterium XBB1006]|nr:hypothetical protein SAMN02910358_00678 [Lachnospiraceae bacterium XBB1006]